MIKTIVDIGINYTASMGCSSAPTLPMTWKINEVTPKVGIKRKIKTKSFSCLRTVVHPPTQACMCHFTRLQKSPFHSTVEVPLHLSEVSRPTHSCMQVPIT